jgi:tetratricopeptide (TPR) repeat protein
MQLNTTLRQHLYQCEYQDALKLCRHNDMDDAEFILLKGLTLLFNNDESGRTLLNQVIESEPATPQWESDLSLALFFLGKIKKARQHLLCLVNKKQADAVAYSRLGGVYLTELNLEKSHECYLEAIKREPGRAEWHNNLAGILVRQQKFEEALENYEIALKIKPEFQQAQQSHQQVLVALERTEELVLELQAELKKNPDDHKLKLRIARAYDLDNRPAEAVKLLRQALIPVSEIKKPDPESPEPDSNDQESEQPPRQYSTADTYIAQFSFRLLLSEIFTSHAMHNKALAVLNQMEKMEPENPVPVICKQAGTLSEMMRYEEALDQLDLLEENYSDNNVLKTTRANVLCEKGDYEKAEGILRELLETYPGDANLLTQLGQTLLWVGELDEAVEYFEKASDINPMALAQIVSAKKIPEDPEALEKMQALSDNLLMPDLARQNMSFALSTVYDKQKNYDAAFHYLSQANRLANKRLKYKPDGFTKRTEAVAKVFNQHFFSNLKPIRKSDRTPVFVVGMPRSGTTLTEQILCSHPDIFGAGELPIIPRLIGLLPKVLKARHNFPWCVVRFTPHLREEAARHYLYNLYEYDSEHPYVVDKMPHNFVNLGLIAMIFPKARIIHVNRDPRDNAVSNFQQNFKERHGGMGFAFDLENIACQINDYNKLMNHWRQTLPLPIFDLSYEAMVEDMEDTAKKLLDFVGVGWHEDVTKFYDTKRAVRTASVAQVRQPIYNTSMKKWKGYEHHLDDLLNNLDPEVTVRYDTPDEGNNPYKSRIIFKGEVVPFSNG